MQIFLQAGAVVPEQYKFTTMLDVGIPRVTVLGKHKWWSKFVIVMVLLHIVLQSDV